MMSAYLPSSKPSKAICISEAATGLTPFDDFAESRGSHIFLKMLLPPFHFRTVCGLLMMAASQNSFFALRALNVELASITNARNVHQQGAQLPEYSATLALQIKVQWWRQAIDKIYGDDDKITVKLTAAVSSFGMPIYCWNSQVVRALDRVNQESDFTIRFIEHLSTPPWMMLQPV
jgi:hypothetical protein